MIILRYQILRRYFLTLGDKVKLAYILYIKLTLTVETFPLLLTDVMKAVDIYSVFLKISVKLIYF